MKVSASMFNASPEPDGSTFEAQLSLALKTLPPNTELEKKFGEEGDRVRVRRRQIISAVLDALFFSDIIDKNDETIDTGKDDYLSDLFIEFAAARRDFMHDCERLDNGIGAELILTPSGKESTISVPAIKADRKILIEALVALELGRGHKDLNKQTASNRVKIMAEVAGYTPATMTQYRKEMSKSLAQSGKKRNPRLKSEFSDAECQYFRQLQQRVTRIADTPGQGMDLLMPGVRGHRKSRVPKAETVASKKRAEIGNGNVSSVIIPPP